MCARSDAVRDGMRRLTRIAGCINAVANDTVDFAKRRAIANATNGIGKYLE